MKQAASDNEVIAYFDGKAIVRDENGELFYIRIPYEYVTFGEAVFSIELKPFDTLHPAELQDLRDYLKKQQRRVGA